MPILYQRAGQAVIGSPGEWVRSHACKTEGAEYVTVCLPAFSPTTVHYATPSEPVTE